MVYSAITWIFAVATFGAVFVAFGIGANDFGNSFSTSVGAGAISMKQAMALSAVCEFGGAVLMGAGVTDTIRDQVADVAAFAEKPDIFAYGMLCALMASGVWLIAATYCEIPVSTTHSIVGAIVGMTMVAAGPGAVNWSEHTDSFPFLGGISSIVLSWLFSPILTGALALVLFTLLRALVLRSPHAYKRAYYVLPLLCFVTFFMISMFIIQQGGNRFHWDATPLGKAAWISACVGTGGAALAVAVQWLLIHTRVSADLKREEEAAAARAVAEAAFADVERANGGGGARLEGCADDLITDVIGDLDPLDFGFSCGGKGGFGMGEGSTVGSLAPGGGADLHSMPSMSLSMGLSVPPSSSIMATGPPAGLGPGAAAAAAGAGAAQGAVAPAGAGGGGRGLMGAAVELPSLPSSSSPTATLNGSAGAGPPAAASPGFPSLAVLPSVGRNAAAVSRHSSGLGSGPGVGPRAGGAGAPQAALHKFRESRLWSVLTYGSNFDIHEVVETDEKISSIHYHSERFDWRAESVFNYLQVFTGCTNSFAHGSNDVANAIGPYAAIYFVWQNSSVEMSSAVPIWILALGGAGIVLGACTYGFQIMRILGVKMCRLTSSRGFVVEISAAAIIILGSRFSLPISTTHCLVGAVAGIGLLEGRRGFNWVLIFRFMLGWAATLVITGLTAALFTAQGIYSPNNTSAARRYQMVTYLEDTTGVISGMLAGSGVPGAANASAALNASLAALPVPLLNVSAAAELQWQAMQDYGAATTWINSACAGNGTAVAVP